ncbi:arginine/serine rich splicing factor sf4/14, putative [Pediculus humanus corporis]|uniref:Arginine/serine rich splicing factor sf4/14, putative n=1 Tax=Pediculus humanus subsp. corporis TaxID=121224 RepID=E0VRM1_PEDHC|nr:arginine/serine rich splicing factor sf4/14, putative [Pediculus humanus corporis]EEB16027.1 arginine/serine rich splicing factor sf4/14, putative [Pediculus humanus corporis]
MRFSRTERLAQLSEQEIIIEKKKKEIQAKLEAQKKKETEDAFKKLNNFDGKNMKFSSGNQSRHITKKREKSPEIRKKDCLTNAFSNDGSFLDQFKKLSQTEQKISTNNDGNALPKSSDIQFQIPPPGIAELNPQNAYSAGLSNQFEAPHVKENIETYTSSIPLSKENQLTKNHVETISMAFKTNTIKKLELASNPLKDEDEDEDDDIDKNKIGSRKLFKDKNQSTKEMGFFMSKMSDVGSYLKNTSNNFNTGFQTEFTSNYEEISRTLDNPDDKQGQNQDKNQLAEVVAKCGDDFEEILWERNKHDPALKFLSEKSSNEYLSFRKLVLNYRHKLREEEEEVNKELGNSCRVQDLGGKEKLIDSNLPPQGQELNQIQDLSDDEPFGFDNNREKGKTMEGQNFEDCSLNTDEMTHYKIPESSSQGYEIFSKNDHKSDENPTEQTSKSLSNGEGEKTDKEKRKRKRKSRWGDVATTSGTVQPPSVVTNLTLQAGSKLPTPKTNLLSQLTRSDPGLLQYARQTFGSTNLSEEDWKKAEDHYKINLLYQDLVKKRAEIDKLEKAGKFKYEYDSDEDVEGGTWEHKLRQQEMMATQLWAEELTRQAAGKHHIGDFLPPEELERFMERYNAVKEGREPDLSDYKEFKLKEDNVGYKLLQKMGWNEGQGLGQNGSGITLPVNKAVTRHENQGLGVERHDGLEPGDDEYDAYRKRMMLAYRFRPNPLVGKEKKYIQIFHRKDFHNKKFCIL